MSTPIRPFRQALRHAPLALVGVGALALGMPWLTAIWFAAARLAYVVYVGVALRAEIRRPSSARGVDPETTWRAFRRKASWLMDHDAVAFVALCIVTRRMSPVDIPDPVAIGTGAALVVAGLGLKAWAAKSLPEGAYFWRDVFVPTEHATAVSAAGPYRWLNNPMYTLGYAHAYGCALALESGPGMIAAACAHAAVLAMHAASERAHVTTLRQAGANPPPLR